jgi:hypothetical protein
MAENRPSRDVGSSNVMKGVVVMERKERNACSNVVKGLAVGIFVFAVAAGMFAGIRGDVKWNSASAWAASPEEGNAKTSPTLFPKTELSGVYGASLPAASSPGRKIELRLDDDGKARFVQDYLNGEPPVESEGEWDFDPDKQRVTIDFPDDPKMAFVYADGTLRLVDYDANVWGENGLSLAKSAD